MWNKITAESFVPAGFIDSGWSAYSVYFEGLLPGIDLATKILRKSARQTEITQLRGVQFFRIAEPPVGGEVVDVEGRHVKMFGW